MTGCNVIGLRDGICGTVLCTSATANAACAVKVRRSIFSARNCTLRAERNTLSTLRALIPLMALHRVHRLRLGIRAPWAMQRAPLQEYRCAYPGAIVQRKALHRHHSQGEISRVFYVRHRELDSIAPVGFQARDQQTPPRNPPHAQSNWDTSRDAPRHPPALHYRPPSP